VSDALGHLIAKSSSFLERHPPPNPLYVAASRPELPVSDPPLNRCSKFDAHGNSLPAQRLRDIGHNPLPGTPQLRICSAPFSHLPNRRPNYAATPSISFCFYFPARPINASISRLAPSDAGLLPFPGDVLEMRSRLHDPSCRITWSIRAILILPSDPSPVCLPVPLFQPWHDFQKQLQPRASPSPTALCRQALISIAETGSPTGSRALDW